MLVLDGYFDESYDRETMVVAGFLAYINGWREFEREWNAALVEYDLPFFHMANYAHKVHDKGGDYRWKEDIRRSRMAHLCGLIDKYTLTSYGVGVPKRLFEGVFSEKARKIIGGAYGFAANQCMLLAASDLDGLPVETGVHYVFEDGMNGKGDVIAAYDALDLLPGGRPRFHAIALDFHDKRRFVPLQAADILAYELFKNRPKDDGPENPNPRMPLRLIRNETSTWKYMKESDLKAYAAIVNGMTEIVRPDHTNV